jgi:probable F420-dependent oxidoreductase
VHTDHVPAPQQALEAEQLGFRRLFLSERHNVKNAGVILGAAAAVTRRIGVATGAAAASARRPIVNAAIGATLNATFGPRFVLGLGRGTRQLYAGHGFAEGGMVGYQHLIDHADIVKRLWRGETVDYKGPAGEYSNLQLADRPPEPPQIWFVSAGGPKASRIAANPVFDGHVIPDMLTAATTRKSAAWTRAECERIGRDPAGVRICQCVITAPDCGDRETVELVHARIALSLPYAGFGETVTELNDWDPKVMHDIRDYLARQQGDGSSEVDAHHRSSVLDVARDLVPEEYARQAAAIGTAAECVETLKGFREAGADEIAVYGSTPAQNAGLIKAWRSRT